MAGLARSKSARAVYLALGLLFLAIGMAGTVLPLIPTTGPILLAAFFFSRSSERFDHWITHHRLFGPMVRDWRAGLGFTVRAKVIAVIAITITFVITIAFAIESMILDTLLVLLALGLVVYIIRLPTKPMAVAEAVD